MKLSTPMNQIHTCDFYQNRCFHGLSNTCEAVQSELTYHLSTLSRDNVQSLGGQLTSLGSDSIKLKRSVTLSGIKPRVHSVVLVK